jgi:type II secretory pathway component PulF
MRSFSEHFAALVIGHHGTTRIGFYEGFRNLVENGMSSYDALEELHKIESHDFKKPDEPLAILTHDLMMKLEGGEPLSQALARWVPYEEASLLAAGERGAGLGPACDDVIRVIEAKQQISGAVAAALAYPSFLLIPLFVTLWMVANQLVPKMAKLSDPAHWTGSAYALNVLARFVTDWGLYSLIALVVVIAAFFFSLPRWTGGLRMMADRGPLYSTYRMVHGSTFLLNLAVMMRAGISANDCLSILGQYANPWLKERLSATQHGLEMGSNLGVALLNTGHGFPDKKAVQYLRVLATRKGFSEAINRYANRWLAQSIKNLQQFAKTAFTVALLLLGSVMGLIVMGTQDMQNSFDQTTSRATSRVAAP